MDDPNLGWEDPIDQANSLRVAVEHLVTGGMSLRNRLGRATPFLTKYRRWPERLKTRVENLINAYKAAPRDYQYEAEGAPIRRQLDFGTPRECRALADDIFALYEACLLDIGRMHERGGLASEWYNIMYPKGVASRIIKLRRNDRRNPPVYEPRALKSGLWSDP
jgi:hypothetical protein